MKCDLCAEFMLGNGTNSVGNCFLVSDKAFSILTDYCTDDEADYFISNREKVSKSIICVMGQLQERLEELENQMLDNMGISEE